MSDDVEEIPDCQSCGACCSTGYIVGVHHDEREAVERRLESKRLPMLVQSEGVGEPLMVVKEDGRCVAFYGTVGVKTSCGIYDSRPRCCSAFKPGGDACLEIRAVFFGNYRHGSLNLNRHALVPMEKINPSRFVQMRDWLESLGMYP